MSCQPASPLDSLEEGSDGSPSFGGHYLRHRRPEGFVPASERFRASMGATPEERRENLQAVLTMILAAERGELAPSVAHQTIGAAYLAAHHLAALVALLPTSRVLPLKGSPRP